MARSDGSGVVRVRWIDTAILFFVFFLGSARTSIRQVVVRRCCPSSTSTVPSDKADVALVGRRLGPEAVAVVGFAATQMRPTLCPAWNGGSLS